MYFEKKEEVIIDGNKYQISMGAMNDTFDCKEKFTDIYNKFEPDMFNDECQYNNYTAWKKEIVKMCKEWDKAYLKHVKSFYAEMNTIHQTAMKPLMDLITANRNLYNLEQMIKNKKDVP